MKKFIISLMMVVGLLGSGGAKSVSANPSSTFYSCWSSQVGQYRVDLYDSGYSGTTVENTVSVYNSNFGYINTYLAWSTGGWHHFYTGGTNYARLIEHATNGYGMSYWYSSGSIGC